MKRWYKDVSQAMKTMVTYVKNFMIMDTGGGLDAWKATVQIRAYALLNVIYIALMLFACILTKHWITTVFMMFSFIASIIGLELTFYQKRWVAGEYMYFYTLLSVVIYVYVFGWNIGVQHFLFVTLIYYFLLDYACICQKVMYATVLLFTRLFLFVYTYFHGPLIPVVKMDAVVMQVYNTVMIFAMGTALVALGTMKGQRLKEYAESEHENALRDPLTGLENRRALYEYACGNMHWLRNHYGEAKYFDRILDRDAIQDTMQNCSAVAIADIDYFKRINDTYGHAAGDQVLRQLGSMMQEYVGPFAKVVRWGGEEFVFFFEEMSVLQVEQRMQELRNVIQHEIFSWEGQAIPITMTIGIAEHRPERSVSESIGEADKKLYQGKNSGRNTIVV